MTTRTFLAGLVVSTALLAVAGCGGSDDGGASNASATSTTATGGGTITGAGSTFAAPLYDQLGADFKDQNGTAVNYQSVGSGAGVAQFQADTVDYGATDVALTDDELATARKKGTPLDVPVAFGAVTVAYNLSGVKSGLKLDGATIADAFVGKIKRWNDPEIAKLNPGVTLPGTAITIVHRSDGSGTTAQFTQFLSDESPSWKSRIGTDKTVDWPVGTGSKGNEGVAATVKQTSGALGYVELAYALQNDFTTAAVKNTTGDYVTPSLASTSAAGQGLRVPDDLRFTAIDSPAAKAYPIASATFALVYRDMCKAGRPRADAQRTRGFLDYVLTAGQRSMREIQYAPLPADLLAKAKAKVQSMQCDGSALGS
jgi:phosphate transport system substrate-binding protein